MGAKRAVETLSEREPLASSAVGIAAPSPAHIPSVAERMAANPGSKKYGSFSIFTQYHAEIKLNSFVSKSSFIPWPEVGSAIVVLKPHKEPKYKVKDEKLFFDIVHAAFQQRRKKLRNSLAKFKLEGIDLDLNQRPEMLSIENFIAITNQAS